MDEKKIAFLVAQIRLGKITLADIPKQFRDTVEEELKATE